MIHDSTAIIGRVDLAGSGNYFRSDTTAIDHRISVPPDRRTENHRYTCDAVSSTSVYTLSFTSAFRSGQRSVAWRYTFGEGGLLSCVASRSGGYGRLGRPERRIPSTAHGVALAAEVPHIVHADRQRGPAAGSARYGLAGTIPGDRAKR